MNAFLTKTLLAGLSAAAIGGSAGYAYYHQTPKSIGELIQWEGNRLISKNNAENTYKAIIEEQTKEILKKEIEELSSVGDDKLHEELKKICERELSKKINNDSKSSKDKYKKFCTDSVQTVKGKLIKKGVSSFISQESGDEDWKTVFATNRSHNSFIKWIDSSGINSDTKIQEGYSALKNRCNTELSSTNSTDINRVEWWCTVPEDKTIGDLINKEIKEGKKKVENWEEALENWKHTTDLINLVNKEKNNDGEKIKIEEPETNKDKNKEILKKWCENSESDKLGDEEIFDKKRDWVINVCLIKNG